MSVANAHQFLEILANNPEVKDQLYVAALADAQELISFAMQKGCVFSEEDLHSALSEHPNPSLADQLNEILEA